jgi:hypothetical protein
LVTRPRPQHVQRKCRIPSSQHFHNFPTGGSGHHPRPAGNGKSGRCLSRKGWKWQLPIPLVVG